MKKLLALMSLLAVVLVGMPATAQEEEGQYASQEEEPASYEFIQGTITNVSTTHEQIRVEGEDGSLTDFEVPHETPIYYASVDEIPIYYASVDVPLLPPTRGDLLVGQAVEVGFYVPEVDILIYPARRTADQITIFV